jgi:hypothetical protein
LTFIGPASCLAWTGSCFVQLDTAKERAATTASFPKRGVRLIGLKRLEEAIFSRTYVKAIPHSGKLLSPRDQYCPHKCALGHTEDPG